MTGQEPDILHYTITGASDWPMFKFLFIFLCGAFSAMWGVIVALIGLQWRDLKTRISSQRKDDKDSCKSCKSENTREMDAIWDNIHACCKASGVAPITRKDLELEPT